MFPGDPRLRQCSNVRLASTWIVRLGSHRQPVPDGHESPLPGAGNWSAL